MKITISGQSKKSSGSWKTALLAKQNEKNRQGLT